METSKKIVLYSFILTVVSFTLSLVIFEYFYKNSYNSSNLELVAKVTYSENTSRKKPEKHRYWKNLQVHDLLYSGETLKTTEDSILEIEFTNKGGTLRLEPNSLVQLKKMNEKMQLQLFEGQFTTEAKSQIEVVSTKDEAPIKITGKAEVVKKGKKHKIQFSSLNEATEIIQNKQKIAFVKKLKNSLNSPDQAKISSDKKDVKDIRKYYLSWIDEKKITDYQKNSIVLNSDSKPIVLNANKPAEFSVQNNLTSIIDTDSPLKLKAIPAANSVEPSSVATQGKDKSEAKIKKIPERKPAALFTSNSLKANSDGSILIEWKNNLQIQKYDLKLLNSNGKVIKSWSQKKNSSHLKKLKPGQYTFKINGTESSGNYDLSEVTQTIEVPNENNIKRPKLKGIKIK